MTVNLLATTDLSVRPENEFSVNSDEQLGAAVNACIDKRYSSFFLIFDNDEYFKKQDALSFIAKQLHASYRYSWNNEMHMLTIYPNY